MTSTASPGGVYPSAWHPPHSLSSASLGAHPRAPPRTQCPAPTPLRTRARGNDHHQLAVKVRVTGLTAGLWCHSKATPRDRPSSLQMWCSSVLQMGYDPQSSGMPQSNLLGTQSSERQGCSRGAEYRRNRRGLHSARLSVWCRSHWCSRARAEAGTRPRGSSPRISGLGAPCNTVAHCHRSWYSCSASVHHVGTESGSGTPPLRSRGWCTTARTECEHGRSPRCSSLAGPDQVGGSPPLFLLMA